MTPRSVFPARLGLGDLLFDPHEGFDAWLPIVALALEAEHVVVHLGSDPEPVALPVGRLVKVQRASEEELEVAPGVEVSADKSNFYAGDIVAARTAARQHTATTPPTPTGDGRPADPYKSAWYPGDLDSVMGQSEGSAQAGERRRQAMSEKSKSAPRRKVSDQDEVMKESDEVEERMGGWYAGDLDFIIKQHK